MLSFTCDHFKEVLTRAGDLATQSSFMPLDISHSLQVFIKQFSVKVVKVEVLLETFHKNT